MMKRWNDLGSHRAWLVPFVLLAASSSSALAGVQVALVPSASTVAKGAPVTVRLEVTQAGSEFNGYQATIGYDPAALTFVASSPISLQEGSYMTDACGTTFHWFTSGTTQVGMVHSLLCSGKLLTGPGTVYLLHFVATGGPGTTQVSFARLDFAAAGIPVPVTSATNASIQISSPSDAALPTAAVCAVHAAPNPFNPTTTIRVEGAAGPQTLQIFDLSGRLVRSLEHGEFPAGRREVVWDGRDAAGTRLASGVYWVVLQAGAESATQRVVLLK